MDWYIQFVRQLDKVAIDNSTILAFAYHLWVKCLLGFDFDRRADWSGQDFANVATRPRMSHLRLPFLLTFLIRIQFGLHEQANQFAQAVSITMPSLNIIYY